jgi:hypothetical protein
VIVISELLAQAHVLVWTCLAHVGMGGPVGGRSLERSMGRSELQVSLISEVLNLNLISVNF